MRTVLASCHMVCVLLMFILRHPVCLLFRYIFFLWLGRGQMYL